MRKGNIGFLLCGFLIYAMLGDIAQAQDQSDAGGIVRQATELYEQRRYDEALPLFRQAAEQGNADAQVKLGNMYVLGQGVPENERIAVQWFKKAAAQGAQEAKDALKILANATQAQDFFSDRRAWSQAIDLYKQGNYKAALPLAKESAEHGDADAQFLLGGMYFQGHGIDQNEQLAVQWWEKAAEQDHQDAQNMLKLVRQHYEEQRRLAERRYQDEEQRFRACSQIDSFKYPDAWHVCRGKCDFMDSRKYPDAWQACRGECDFMDSRKYTAEWRACRGDCSNFSSDQEIWSACNSCGGGPRWTAMYMLGATMRCR